MEFGKGFNRIIVLAALAWLGGCSSMQVSSTPSTPSLVSAKASSPEQQQLDQFLNQSAPHASTVLAASAWGNDIELTAESSYYAASGLTCRKLLITGDGQANQGLTCLQADGHWTPSRLFK